MNREAMEKWIAALEDPANEGRQIKYTYNDEQGGVCALGLGHEVLGLRGNGYFVETIGGPQYTVIDLTPNASTFVDLANDDGWSFWDIAQALRATHLKENS